MNEIEIARLKRTWKLGRLRQREKVIAYYNSRPRAFKRKRLEETPASTQ